MTSAVAATAVADFCDHIADAEHAAQLRKAMCAYMACGRDMECVHGFALFVMRGGHEVCEATTDEDHEIEFKLYEEFRAWFRDQCAPAPVW